jgi:hypothetical protein
MNFLAGKEFPENWFDIEHWRSVKGIKSLDRQRPIVTAKKPADRQADLVGAIPGALGEDPDYGPGLISARMSRPATDRLRLHLIHEENYFEMREILDPVQRLLGEFGRQGDRRNNRSPVIILVLGPFTMDNGNRLKRNHRFLPDFRDWSRII